MKGKNPDPSLQLALAAADLADDGKATGITILHLREVSSVADYFVIASGRSHIQVEAICDRIAEGLRDRLDRRPIAVEGLEQALWGILDYGSVVVHVFQESQRELYDLERLWSLAPRWKHGEAPPKPKAADSTAAAGDGKPEKKKAPAKKPAAAKTTANTSPKTSAKAPTKASAKPAAKKPAAPKATKKPATKTAAAKRAAKPATKPAAAKKPARKAASPEA